jgi:hypothetical protein
MTLRTEPSDRDVRTRFAVFRNVDLGTRFVTVCVVSLVAGRSGGKRDNDNKRYTMRLMVLYVLLLHISFLRVLVVLYLRVTCICVA